jgi:hypothetical protein
MKYRNVALFCIIASLFLLFGPKQAVTAAAGTTVTLRVPNLLLSFSMRIYDILISMFPEA